MRSFYFFFVKYIKKVLTCTTESYNCNFKNKHNKKQTQMINNVRSKAILQLEFHEKYTALIITGY
ncbi:hypothetical protein SAMN05444409_3177 [Epilithonimonas zeae]|uniref:Uncharacterized protein n=1 Tax=Epilithonimonas zeae TaxID=1416779 RepID=A0A1N6J0F4_9FLAO|nr:hypothetical protein SAMN05444409_3177 [Epilithonimonas zeae]